MPNHLSIVKKSILVATLMFLCAGLSSAQSDTPKMGGIIDGHSRDPNEKFFMNNYYYRSTSGDTVFYVNGDTKDAYTERDSKWVMYHSNGAIKEMGRFKPYARTSKKLIKNYQIKKGKWRFYSSDGKLVKEEKYYCNNYKSD